MFDWDPADGPAEANSPRLRVYQDRTDDGRLSGSKDARFAVHTIQLESKPLPFPELEGSEHAVTTPSATASPRAR